eukprot:10462912-Alexandrium_andersonii.AAC.1
MAHEQCEVPTCPDGHPVQADWAGGRRGKTLLDAGSSAHRVAVLAMSMSGRQVMHALFHMLDRSPGQAEREAMQGVTSLQWGTDDFQGTCLLYTSPSPRD